MDPKNLRISASLSKCCEDTTKRLLNVDDVDEDDDEERSKVLDEMDTWSCACREDEDGELALVFLKIKLNQVSFQYLNVSWLDGHTP